MNRASLPPNLTFYNHWVDHLMEWSSLIVLVLILLASELVRRHFRGQNQIQAQEPSSLHDQLPFIGHIFGITTKQVGHFHDLRKKTTLSAATLPILNGKIYAVFEPALIQLALRSPSLSFEPLMIQHAQGLLGVNEDVLHAVRSGLLGDLLRATKPAFSGEQLEKYNLRALSQYATVINRIQPETPLKLSKLQTWLQDVVTVASAETLYGDSNPIRMGSSLIKDVWTLEGGVQSLSLNFVPSITARRPYKARERLVIALAPLFEPARAQSLPCISRSRADVIRGHGITNPTDIARCELALLHVATVNTVPILFWLIVNISAKPDLVAALRSECASLVSEEHGHGQERPKKLSVSIGSLQRKCPLLTSSLQECLRVYGQALHSRRVLNDVVLTDPRGNQYLFKGGVDVMMPSGVANIMPGIWGADAGDFKATRFMSWPENATPDQRAAYVPFGGGKHLCPGRNFATVEILGFVAALVLGTEIKGHGGPGKTVKVPDSAPAILGQAISKPKAHVTNECSEVTIQRREGFEYVEWKFCS
ncbi:prostacyclin synthase [Colletotrichum phormii]|uniref:Prostacyclin synthase n=1 Tax=Colletotrichum phormii TaxID=359342 RepID=A0AAJ0EAY1_9PEZI|nr:prostacyclin synthase [Colletotrichum phormii]KAK1623163.1 prostacyclin synthase [Colletotrichum phormii]